MGKQKQAYSCPNLFATKVVGKSSSQAEILPIQHIPCCVALSYKEHRTIPQDFLRLHRSNSRIFWPERPSNHQLWEVCKEVPIDRSIKRRKWIWVGSTQAFDRNPLDKRKRGRPRPGNEASLQRRRICK
ncbi:unnamed protein product [Pieris macdunnoughi]|uniref:Uncharacterized protein n=1 Tax=Pieris macdunnoughi TaxID=345717 RepID=A0A821TP26_9NEOP|nr:unnamed protein product [Pieris macdunnoughi]